MRQDENDSLLVNVRSYNLGSLHIRLKCVVCEPVKDFITHVHVSDFCLISMPRLPRSGSALKREKARRAWWMSLVIRLLDRNQFDLMRSYLVQLTLTAQMLLLRADKVSAFIGDVPPNIATDPVCVAEVSSSGQEMTVGSNFLLELD